MRQHGSARRTVEPMIDALIHFAHHIGNRADTLFEEAEDLRLTLFAVAHHPARETLRVVNGFAMRGVVNPIIALDQQLEAAHIIGHIAVGRGDDRG